MARSKVEERRRKLRLDLLEVAWDPDGREIVQSEMDEIGLSRDSLFVEMRAAGWDQSHTTLGRWLRGQSEPSATELGLLTAGRLTPASISRPAMSGALRSFSGSPHLR